MSTRSRFPSLRPATTTSSELPVSRFAVGLAGAGVVLVVLAFTVLSWFKVTATEYGGFFKNFGPDPGFTDVRHGLDSIQKQVDAAGLSNYVSFDTSKPYFTWLGYLLLVLATGLTALAVSPFGATRFYVRWLAAVAAVSGGAMSVLALNLVVFQGNAANNANAPSYGDFFSHSGPGAWAAIAGFALLTVAALLPHPTV